MVIAVGLFLLHSALPHEHDSRLSTIELSANEPHSGGFFELIIHVFGLDMGEDHLESFLTSSFFHVDYLIGAHAFSFGWLRIQSSRMEMDSWNVYRSLHWVCAPFRGPPVYC